MDLSLLEALYTHKYGLECKLTTVLASLHGKSARATKAMEAILEIMALDKHKGICQSF